MRLSAIVVWGAAAVLAGCQTPAGPEPGDTYRCLILPQAAINIDGRLDEPQWNKARRLTDFRDPWWTDGRERTEFRAFIDGKNLYFAFVCSDQTPRLDKQWRGKKTLDDEDRVEIYFSLDDGLKKYYCVEIDPEGRVHDFAGAFPRQWDDSWSMPGLKTAGRTIRLPDGSGPVEYTVEGSIPLASLKALGLPEPKPGVKWRMGLFRADLVAAGKTHWITWIVPASDKPAFHVPSAFGYFRFERNWGL